MRPVLPGEILNEEFLKPVGLTAHALAKAIAVILRVGDSCGRLKLKQEAYHAAAN